MKQIWKSNDVEWIDLVSPTEDELAIYSKKYNLDFFTLADCLEPNHLPKSEITPNYTFLILREFDVDSPKFPASIQQMSNKIAIFYNHNFILTVHRSSEKLLDEIKEKYLDPGFITEPSEIVTRLMRYVIRSFESKSLALSEEIDEIEKRVFFGHQSKRTLEELYYLKNTCRLIKKILYLSRDVIWNHVTTERVESALQDAKDWQQKLIHSFDETHDDAGNLSNIYLSIVSQKTNEVMKLLTIYSVFFMPLTFIVGVYGMNFEYMPELHWKYGYHFCMGLMTLISFVIFIWFKRKKVL